MLFSCLIDPGRLAFAYTNKHTNAKLTLSQKKRGKGDKKKKLGTCVNNFACTFAIDTHTYNTTHPSIQAVCRVRESTQADDNVVFLLQGFYGRCASAVTAEGMYRGLVN